MPAPLEVLRHTFGFASFRGPQAAVIERVIAGEHLLLVMPTGGGKSLCYQVPALCRPGAAIVVSPLIALMEDQVAALGQAGVRAAALNSQSSDAAGIAEAFRAGALDLLYVAPERAATEGFRRLAAEAQVALLAIDEAHCVSQWGHDFRPDYRRLRELADTLGQVPRLALTATADASTREDICDQLGIARANVVVAGFDRPNIRYEMFRRRDGSAQLRAFLDRHRGEAGIVYCPSRRETDEVAARIAALGQPARAYHAGLDAGTRTAAQRWFQNSDDGVMVATIAFGMGIDKPDVRFVVHLGLPRSIEAYYQETGRAGRDGLPAVAHMLHDDADILRIRRWIEQGAAEPARRAHELRQLERLVALAEATTCRRSLLLAHFGEPGAAPCGNCDICTDPPELVDLRVPAQKLLSAAFRTGQRFGLQHLARVLRGADDERIARFGHDRLSVHGIGTDLSEAQWLRLGRALEARGLLVRDTTHGGLALGAGARAMLKGETAFALPAEQLHPKPGRARQRRRTATSAGAPGANPALVARLKAWRKEQAEKQGVPAFVVLHDSSLLAIAEARPQGLADLAACPGIGAAKLERYGAALLALTGAE
jgi:ATP-dependent DNA helicase RecQ